MNDFPVIIPENDYGVEPGYYYKSDFVYLLRKYKNDPEIIQFIADMLE